MTENARYWIDRLGLIAHPEGGYFRETYRAAGGVALPGRYGGPRSFSTAIYFLLERGQVSKLHRIASDEVWHFHTGGAVTVHALTPDGHRHDLRLGLDFDAGQRPQAMVGAGNWFGASLADDAEFALVGCTVAPGFEFEDFEMANRETLLKRFPEHAEFVTRMT